MGSGTIQRNLRELKISKAKLEFSEAFTALEKKYNLTFGEMFEMLSEMLARIAHDLVETERDEP